MKNMFIIFRMICITFILSSCSKNEVQTENPPYLTVDLPRAELKNDTYYLIDYRERSIELDFSLALDSSAARSNIQFSDQGLIPDSDYKVVVAGAKVILVFQPGFELKNGWQYKISFLPGFVSTTGIGLPAGAAIEMRTATRRLSDENDSIAANSILCISDIHMGDGRAASLGYCWFKKNAEALESLLDLALTSGEIRQVVIMGDLFDEWVIPYRMYPFDSSAGIGNSQDYFLSVANSPVNSGIISRLKQIATSGTIQLIYVPGNHDMLLTKEILEGIIPGIIWQGDSEGLGHYSPFGEIIMEHGHRYDFFNCPQPFAVTGHILPPGYFISRLDAEGLLEHGPAGYRKKSLGSDAEFLAAWTVAFTYLEVKYSMNVAADSSNILLNGIDGYSHPLSYNGVKEMYAATIENVWNATQTGNQVPVSMPVLMAILDGNSDLYLTSAFEYMQSLGPKNYKLVLFGHTHNPMIKVYPAGKQYSGIYANTGSWVDAGLSSKQVRTFILVRPGEWTGSSLDVVSLYQYNLESGGGQPSTGYVPVLLSEESISR